MKKKSLKKRKLKNVFTKSGIIKVDTHINEDNSLLLMAMSLEEYFKHDENKYDRELLLSKIKTTYDVYVLHLCTNIKIDGEDVSHLLGNSATHKVFKNIYNYKDVWTLILKAISNKNIRFILQDIMNDVPTAEEMDKTIGDMGDFLNTIAGQDELLGKIKEEVLFEEVKKGAIKNKQK